MKQKVRINGKYKYVYFDIYEEFKISRLLFTRVMSIRVKETGQYLPIPYEKERIDFIKSIFEKDRKKFFFLPKKWIGEVKYYLIDTRKREDLNWLYPGNKKNKWEPKVKKQKNKKSKNVNFLKERTQEIPEIKKLHKRDKEERSRRREKDLNDPIYLKLLEKSLTEKTLLGGPKKTKKKKIAKNKDDKYVDAMYYRLPGSFGTGKRR